MDRRLGDSIHIDEFGVTLTMPREPGSQHSGFQSLATENDITQPGRSLSAGRFGGHELSKGRRSLIEDGNFLFHKQVPEFVGGSADREWDDHQSPPIQERTPDLPDRKIEGERVE